MKAYDVMIGNMIPQPKTLTKLKFPKCYGCYLC